MQIMKRNTVTALAFQSNPLFAQVRPGEIDCITVSYKHGEPVEDRIGETPCVGLVATGSVDVFSSSPNGGKLAVSTLRAGDAFGICNIYSDQRMPTMLVCRTAAKIVFITKEQFSALLAAKPEMLFSYLALCNNKMVFLATKIELAAISTCRGKILFYLQQSLGPDGRTVFLYQRNSLRACSA